MAGRASSRPSIVACTMLLVCASTIARAGGPPIVVVADGRTAEPTRQRVSELVAQKRVLRRLRPLPPPTAEPTSVAADGARVKAIGLALERARQHESEAAWDACASEGAGALGDAIDLLASTASFTLLRELHTQIGACMSLGANPSNATPHFLAAALLDESPPETGRHREEAEQAHARAREEVLARSRGRVRIETDPPGAEVWIDGRRAAGTTPLAVEVRLGDHFVTIRRFRYEPRTERRVLHPDARARFVLDRARSETLRAQLADVAAGKAKVNDAELRLGRALWSHASQLLWVASGEAPSAGTRLSLIDAASGAVVRTRVLPAGADEAVELETVCGVLGEICLPPDEGVPWYVWPLAGVAVVGAAIAIGFAADAARPTVFCPSGGCD